MNELATTEISNAEITTTFAETERTESKNESTLKWYLNSIKHLEPLTETELANAIQRKDTDYIIEHNLKLVVFFAKSYRCFTNGAIDFMDIIQQGNIGLSKAVEKYSLEKNCKFSYYAGQWIKHEILRYIENNSSIIRISCSTLELERKLRETEKKLDIHKENYSVEELVEMLGISEIQAHLLADSLAMKNIATLEIKGENGENTCLADTIAQTCFETPERAVERKETTRLVRQAINKLTPSQSRVMHIYCDMLGETDNPSATEIAKMLGISQQAVSKTIALSMKKLKPIIAEMQIA